MFVAFLNHSRLPAMVYCYDVYVVTYFLNKKNIRIEPGNLRAVD
jgi:hypothetical protein